MNVSKTPPPPRCCECPLILLNCFKYDTGQFGESCIVTGWGKINFIDQSYQQHLAITNETSEAANGW